MFCASRQYFGSEGSNLSAQFSIPPVRFETRMKPVWRRKRTALALRAPLLQCATITLLESNSCTRWCRLPSGIGRP